MTSSLQMRSVLRAAAETHSVAGVHCKLAAGRSVRAVARITVVRRGLVGRDLSDSDSLRCSSPKARPHSSATIRTSPQYSR